MDNFDDFMLYAVETSLPDTLICPECEIGVLRSLNDEQMICDLCDCLYVINKKG